MLQAAFIDGLQVREAVKALEQLVTAQGKPLLVALLESTAEFSAPATYQTALRKLGSRAALHDCLLASNDAEHARAARGVEGLEVLHVTYAAELPLLVAARIGGDSAANRECALRTYLAARHPLELSSIERWTRERIEFRATTWRPVVGAELGDASGVRTAFPVEGVLTFGSDGRVEGLKISEPSDEELSEAKNFVASLVHHGQLETHAQGQRARGTHQIVIDSEGHRRLIRSRVSYR